MMYNSPINDMDNEMNRVMKKNKLQRQLHLYRITTALFGVGLFIMAILKLTEKSIVCGDNI